MSVGAVNKSTGDRIPTAGMPAIDDALDLTSVNPVQNAIITAALANKQDKTDNNLETTAKTIVGAINENAGDIDSLKSGLTNYETQNDLNLEVPDRKNLIPMTVDAIKAANTTGIWSGDSYTLNGVTMAIQKDTDGNVEGVKLTGNNTLGSSFYLYVCAFTCKAGQKYYMNGCPEGGGVSSYLLSISGSYPDTGSGSTINPFSTDTTISVRITIGNGYDFGSGGKIFNPMIRPATITDPTFAPYIPSVDARLDAVESELTNLSDKIKHIFVGGYMAGLALNSGNIGFSVPITGLYTTIVSATQTCTGTIYGSIGAVGSVTFTMASNTLTNGVLSFSLTPSVTLSTYTDNAKVLMCEIDKIEFTVS